MRLECCFVGFVLRGWQQKIYFVETSFTKVYVQEEQKNILISQK